MNSGDRTEGTDLPSDRRPRGREPDGSGGALRRATGRDRDEWFAALDGWDAAGRPYREIAAWLTGEHDLTQWWAQKLIVEYEQARGLRPPGIRPDGTFAVGTTTTVAVPVERLFEASVDPELRERESRRGRSARFDRGDGTRVAVEFAPKGDAKSQAAVEHQRLPNARAAETAKAFWRERMAALKALLES